jgi:hypothetical protein
MSVPDCPELKNTRSMKEVPVMNRVFALFAAAGVVVALAGCGGGGAKAYNIAPIFPLSSDKCARYGGAPKGSGITASCMVTKAECEKAAADWRSAMQNSDVNDAIEFSCQ